jgi:hypothetical protein
MLKAGTAILAGSAVVVIAAGVCRTRFLGLPRMSEFQLRARRASIQMPGMLTLALNRWEKGKHRKHPSIRSFVFFRSIAFLCEPTCESDS